jgi:hypothetical protein
LVASANLKERRVFQQNHEKIKRERAGFGRSLTTLDRGFRSGKSTGQGFFHFLAQLFLGALAAFVLLALKDLGGRRQLFACYWKQPSMDRPLDAAFVDARRSAMVEF